MTDTLGTIMKGYEQAALPARFTGKVPFIARLDGVAFHSWTRGMDRPFSMQLDELRRESTLALMEETGAVAGYCQSDEISLIWNYDDPKSQPYFGGKVFKLTSVLASMLTAVFNDMGRGYGFPLARFDCRVFEVPTKEDAALYVLWRQLDSYRNAATMVAQCHFSHSELLGVNTDQKIDMLAGVGVRFDHYPYHLRWGSFFGRRVVKSRFSAEEIDALPPLHNARRNPEMVFERSVLREVMLPPTNSIVNPVGAVLYGEDPVHRIATGEVQS